MGDSILSSDLSMACERFLDAKGCFSLVEDRCKFFNCLQDQAFELVIPIDVFDLLEFDGDLGNFVLNEPLRSFEVFRDVIHMRIIYERWLPGCRLKSQLSVRLHINRLPPFECYQIPKLRLYRSKICQHKLIQVAGIVSGISMYHKYLKSTKFECVACKKGELTFLRHFGSSDKMLLRRHQLNCKICGLKMEENVSCRVLADKVFFHLMENEEEKYNKISFSIEACARDELTSGVQLGRLCAAVGVPIYDFKKKLNVFEINLDLFSLQNIFPAVPQSILNLFHDRMGSSWGFGLSLAYAFAGKIVPYGTYQALKLALLLSLVSYSNQGYSGLDIMVEGNDTLIIGRLLLYAGQFAQKFSILSPNSILLPALCKDRTGRNYVEGGILNLCLGGVCLVPGLLHADKSLKEKIIQVLDAGSYLPQSHLGLRSNQLLEHRTCQIWTYLESVLLNPSGPQQIPQIKATKFEVLIDLFPIVIRATPTPQSVPDELEVINVLDQAECNDSKETLIPHNDFEQGCKMFHGLFIFNAENGH